MSKVIDIFSNEGDVILDPFLGSGTTLLVSEKMGRTCYGAEIRPESVKMIMSRFKILKDEL